MKALILIGLQVDLFPLGAAGIEGTESTLPVVNDWLPKFEHVVAACFSHPANHKMFVANYPWRRPGQEIDLMGDKFFLKNYYCVENSFGAELMMGFDHQKITYKVEMGTENRLLPYSAFFDENRGRDTGLKSYLTDNGIEEIYLAGLPFEEGVFQTAIDGISEGFAVNILENAIKGRDKAIVNEKRKKLDELGIEFLI